MLLLPSLGHTFFLLWPAFIMICSANEERQWLNWWFSFILGTNVSKMKSHLCLKQVEFSFLGTKLVFAAQNHLGISVLHDKQAPRPQFAKQITPTNLDLSNKLARQTPIFKSKQLTNPRFSKQATSQTLICETSQLGKSWFRKIIYRANLT